VPVTHSGDGLSRLGAVADSRAKSAYADVHVMVPSRVNGRYRERGPRAAPGQKRKFRLGRANGSRSAFADREVGSAS
jgi:hypothetical protein